MTSPKRMPQVPVDLSPEERIRQILAFSLCVPEVKDSDTLDKLPSIEYVEAIITCERTLNIPEIDDDKLIGCTTIGCLVKIINAENCKSHENTAT